MIKAMMPDGTLLLVLDPDATDILLKGEVVPLPELKLALGYVKDPVFVEREMDKAKNCFTAQEIGQLLDAANRREEVRRGHMGRSEAVGVTEN